MVETGKFFMTSTNSQTIHSKYLYFSVNVQDMGGFPAKMLQLNWRTFQYEC